MSVVLADGCFDPLHWGHVRYLAAAAALGELYVRVAPDDEVLAKGRLLFQTRSERLKTVASLRPVEAVISDPLSLAETIRELSPQYLVKGQDWRDRLPEEVIDACAEMETQIIFLETQERTSSERLAG